MLENIQIEKKKQMRENSRKNTNILNNREKMLITGFLQQKFWKMGKNIITEGYKIYVTKLQKGTIILRTILSLKYEIIKKN